MPSVTVRGVHASVPAKVILFGEHFVVYGKRALAAAIDRRLTVEASASTKRGYHVKIENIPTFGLELDFEGPEVGKAQPYKDFRAATDAVAYVKAALEYLREQYGIGREGVELEIRSEIPLSAGLGSSAATCVATIAALRAYFGIDGERNEIQRDAHTVEKRVQGAASPIDTAIATYGGYVLVERTEVKRVELPELDLMVGCIGSIPLSMGVTKATGLSLKTKALVAGVRERRELFRGIFDHLSDAVDDLTTEALRAIEEGDAARLGTLMNINHGLLEAIGVVPRRLSELVKVSQELGALGAKVTGAGGSDDMGGIGSVLVLPGESGARIRAAMEMAGALAMDVKTGSNGLKIELW